LVVVAALVELPPEDPPLPAELVVLPEEALDVELLSDDEAADEDEAASPLVELDEPDELVDFLFDPPEYRSEYQPPPLRMKLPDTICRLACGLLHCGHSRIGSSDMRCTRSNSCPHSSQR